MDTTHITGLPRESVIGLINDIDATLMEMEKQMNIHGIEPEEPPERDIYREGFSVGYLYGSLEELERLKKDLYKLSALIPPEEPLSLMGRINKFLYDEVVLPIIIIFFPKHVAKRKFWQKPKEKKWID